MSNSTALTLGAPQGVSFLNIQSFELAQRVGNMLANSALVPDNYRGNVANCVLALDIAERTGSNVLMVMQNLHVIHGKPSWSSPYIIASITSCGRFTPLRYDIVDRGPLDLKGVKLAKNLECVAYAWERSVPETARTKENRLEGAPVSYETAIKEGWWTKNGSKWATMPELMLRYRAATLFGRMYAPDVLMGMQSQEEVQDIIDLQPLPTDDGKKVLALESKLGGEAETDTKGTRKKRGAAAAGATVEATTAATTTTAAPAPSDTTEPAPEPAQPAATDTAPAPAQPAAQEAPAASQAKIRTSVVKATQICVPAKEAKDGKPAEPERLITQVELKGEEFTGIAYFEAPLIKFEAGDGQVIDAVLERRPHKTRAGEFVNVIVKFDVLA